MGLASKLFWRHRSRCQRVALPGGMWECPKCRCRWSEHTHTDKWQPDACVDRATADMWYIDFTTLVLVILGGIQLGLIGVFGFGSAVVLPDPYAKPLFVLIGFSAVWQLFRQKFH
jgi:uncharacterized membrane protein YuzA (DUF378 family)